MLVQGTVMSLHKIRNSTIKNYHVPTYSAFAGQSSIESTTIDRFQGNYAAMTKCQD